MPVFDYICEADGATKVDIFVNHRDDVVGCWKCGAGMARFYSLGVAHVPGGSWPLTTAHVTGKPETYASQSQLDAACKAAGVVQRSDAAWITQEYTGVNFLTGEQTYKESSGVGLPGSWASKPALLDASPDEIEEFFNR